VKSGAERIKCSKLQQSAGVAQQVLANRGAEMAAVTVSEQLATSPQAVVAAMTVSEQFATHHS
jgi:hypothetical protein